MLNRPSKHLTTAAAIAALALGGAAPVALARHGADDPAGHDRGDDHGGRVGTTHTGRHGADDPAGHDRGDDRGGRRHDARCGHHRHGRHGGHDDGPNHK